MPSDIVIRSGRRNVVMVPRGQGHFAAVEVAIGREGTSSLRTTLFPTMRAGSFGVLRDLHGLYVMASETHIALTIVTQAAKGLRDRELLDVCMHLEEQKRRQLAWLVTQIEHRATGTVVVPQ